MNPIQTRNIAARADHAPVTTTDNYGLVLEYGVIAFFYAGVKSVAVNMGDVEGTQFGMAGHSRRAAGQTAVLLLINLCEMATGAANTGHQF